MKTDALAAERAKLLKMIEHLEKVAVGLHGENAGVSQRALEELKQLREEVAQPQEAHEWGRSISLALELLARLATELLLKALG
jgi:hypothetical protein